MALRNKKTVLVVMDAFRHDYLSETDTPFLYSLLDEGVYYKKLRPSFGFCERTEIFVGEEPARLGYLSAIGFNPDESPYKGFKSFFSVLSPLFERLPNLGKKVIRRLIWEIMSRRENGFPTLAIPLNQLHYFSLTEDGASSAITYDSRSIIRLCSENNLDVNLDSFTSLDSKLVGDDEARCRKLVESIESSAHFYAVYIADCDKYGHMYGPESDEFRHELAKVDARLCQLYSDIKARVKDADFIFCGDHGMTQVSHTVDLISDVRSVLSEFSYGKDFLFFADSTIFRVWVMRKECEVEVRRKLESLFFTESYKELGRFTNPQSLKIKNHRQYGDFLWIAKPGVIISPDFFNSESKSINGMHGYELHDSSYGALVCKGTGFEHGHYDCAPLTIVHSIIKKSLFP